MKTSPHTKHTLRNISLLRDPWNYFLKSKSTGKRNRHGTHGAFGNTAKSKRHKDWLRSAFQGNEIARERQRSRIVRQASMVS